MTETAQGKKLCKFTIAVGRTFDKEKTDFFSCTAWERKETKPKDSFLRHNYTDEQLSGAVVDFDKWEVEK